MPGIHSEAHLEELMLLISVFNFASYIHILRFVLLYS